MATARVHDLLTAWREAERLWERPGSPDEVHAAALAVVEAYLAYQDAVLAPDTREFMLIVDEDQAYVGVSRAVTTVLGYPPEELLGRRITDLATGDRVEATAAQWAAFVAEGRQEGTFELRHRTGNAVALRYQARAHHPVPGFHLSRLWPDEPG
jgi:PAS domain S-box-containing protein